MADYVQGDPHTHRVTVHSQSCPTRRRPKDYPADTDGEFHAPPLSNSHPPLFYDGRIYDNVSGVLFFIMHSMLMNAN